MSEEQMRLLKMIEEHKITAEEGARLLTALGEAQAARERARQEQERPRARVSGRDEDLFWGRRREEERQRMNEERERLREERQRMREETRRLGEDVRSRSRTTPLGPEQVGPGATRFFRVRVSSRESGTPKVDLRLPLGLVNFGLKVGARYLPEHIILNNQEVLEAVRSGAIGRIIEVNDPDSEDRVEIIIEG